MLLLMEPAKKRVSLQVLVSCLLALTAVLQISNAQSCPSGCSGCGGTSTTVTCTNAGLTSFPELPLDVQQRVETLDLSQNMIAVLDESVLENFVALTTLKINNNDLTDLPESLFAANTQLEVLQLVSNQITELPEGIFAANTQLQRLSLEDNQLMTLPEGLFAANTQLTHLHLYVNQITELPEGIFAANTQLQHLDIYGNQLMSLPEGIFDATTQLENLYVRDNPIHCDCKIRWLPSFLSTVNQYREVTCVTPSDLKGTEVTSLVANQLFCDCIPPCVNGTCDRNLGVCDCIDGYIGVDCSIIPDISHCSIDYPITTLEKSPLPGNTDQCAPEQDRSGEIESIREGTRSIIRDRVLPYLQGDLDSCNSP